MSWQLRCAWTIALVVLLPNDAAAIEKTRVGVRLVVQADNFRRLDTDTTLLIRRVQNTAAIILRQKLPYLTFVPGESDHYVLALRLAFRGAEGRRPLDEIGFHVCIIDRGVRGREVYKTVRPMGTATLGVGEWEAASVELEDTIRTLEEKTLVDSVLARVPIADTALCWADPMGWVLPFNRADLCLDDDTELLVRAEMPTLVGKMPFKFESAVSGDFPVTDLCLPCGNRLFTKGVAPEADLLRAKAKHESVRTLGVYVKSMKALSPCPELPAPGGGQP